MISADHIRTLHTSLTSAGARLRTVPPERRAAVIARAAHLLIDDQSQLGAQLRDALLTSTGLSAEVIERGVRTTFKLFERDALLALQRSAKGERRARLAVVVLAGNVFSAAARPLLLPLLCGGAVLAKAASSDDALPHMLKRTLDHVDEHVGAACEIVTFSRDDVMLQDVLFERADVLSVYGSDETIAALRTRVAPPCRMIARGHGLGAIFIASEALTSVTAARMLAGRAAFDIAAYDQRGCLSPHAIFVQRGGAVGAREFARMLSETLQAVDQELPRGRLPRDAAAAQLQWRGVAAAIGELHEGDACAVSYEADHALRASPGYRHVAVYDCDDHDALHARLRPLGSHLKALGVAGVSARRELAAFAPYVCAVGAMQTPPLDAPLDGLHPLEGYAG